MGISRVLLLVICTLVFLGLVYWIIGKIQYRLKVMDIEGYNPTSTLIVPETLVKQAKFPFIDVHNHQWVIPIQDFDELVIEMDELNMAVMVNPSGYQGKALRWSLDNVKASQPDRSIAFFSSNTKFKNWDDENWPKSALDLIQQGYDQGARGFKVFKGFGLTDLDSQGQRIPANDARIFPIWERCAELNECCQTIKLGILMATSLGDS